MTSDRIEMMRECGEYQCPNWCTRPADEGDYQGHFSEWRLVLEKPAVNQDVQVYAQAYRSWDSENFGSVEWSIRGAHATPESTGSRQPQQGEIAQLFLDSPDLDTLIAGVQEVQALADMADYRCEWVWAWDGAEEEYNAADEDEDEDEEDDDEDDEDDEEN